MKASETFHHPDYKHNCAQAIAYKFKHLYADADAVDHMKACGGGRAEGGICGALHAAILALPSQKEQITEKFREQNGNITCRELKQGGKVPCIQCIDSAERIITDAISSSPQ